MSAPKPKSSQPRVRLPARYGIQPTAVRAFFVVLVLMMTIVVAPGVEIPQVVRSAALAVSMFIYGMLASRVALIWQESLKEGAAYG